MILNKSISSTDLKYYVVLLVGTCAVILSALAFEHIGGYQPCKLCLQQREPWYLAIPVLFVALLAFIARWPSFVTRGLVFAGALILIYSFLLGVHHSGVEWGWWEGPGDCGAVEGGLATNTIDLLKQLEQTVGPSCTEASLRVLGLSFAGWNAIASLVLAALAFWTALKS